jgi:aryl-alcohol dehydrogenase-like predicted oxidoreductase
MEIRNVGRSGLRVSAIGLGCNSIGATLDEADSRAVVHKALDLGVQIFNLADFYGQPPGNSEAVLGKLLGGRRKDVVLLTKFGIPLQGEFRFNTSRRYIIGAVEESLRRLNTDWIDVYQIHWPDRTTPLEETLRALDDLIRSGKVRYIACSNEPGWRVVEAHWIARELGAHHFIAAESEYSLLVRDAEKDLIPALQAYGVALLPYFPLASGMLTGKYRRDRPGPEGARLTENLFKQGDRFLNEHTFARVERLEAFARERGHGLLDLALGWLLAQPGVPSVAPGATSPEQVEANVRAAGWKLTPEDLAEVDRLSRAEV